VLKDKSRQPDELSMSIVEGLCSAMTEVVEDYPEGPRVRVQFELAKI